MASTEKRQLCVMAGAWLMASVFMCATARGVHASPPLGSAATAILDPPLDRPHTPVAPGLRAQPSPIVVAIDPGHGGTNLGAPGPMPGFYEKGLTLALGERVKALLAESASPDDPPIVVVLCRNADVLVPIRVRARCAQENGARLLLSLHANAVPPGVSPGTLHGFEVFVLGPREVEGDVSLALLRQSNDADAVWDVHETRAASERSIVLAGLVADHLTDALGAAARRGVRQSGAPLDVLRDAGTAAVLVEVGFIDHPVEGARLAAPEGREPIARALAAAVRAYVAMDGIPAQGTSRRVLGDRTAGKKARRWPSDR